MKVFEKDPVFQKTVLNNGITIVTEHHQQARSICAGIYVDVGTRDEPEAIMGAAHFIEHMVFKGTKTRSTYQIARSLEAVGGDLNAYTTREYTCYHATSLKEHLPLSIEVLADLVSNATFPSKEIIVEKNVVLQEVDMSDEALEEAIFDLYFEHVYKNNSLGWPILGNKESINRMNKKRVEEFYQKHYRGSNLLISVAGNVIHSHVVQLVQQYLGGKRKKGLKKRRQKPRWKNFVKVIKKQSEQAHVLVGLPAPSFKGPLRFEAYIVNALLGGGMTSKLYQKIREQKGLAYSVYSYLQTFTDTGTIAIYAGTGPENVNQVINIIFQEIEKFKKNGITASDLELFKTQVIGNILLGSDDIENRMNSIGINEMIFKTYRPVDTVLKDLENISITSVNKFIKKYLSLKQYCVLVMGDVEADDIKLNQ